MVFCAVLISLFLLLVYVDLYDADRHFDSIEWKAVELKTLSELRSKSQVDGNIVPDGTAAQLKMALQVTIMDVWPQSEKEGENHLLARLNVKSIIVIFEDDTEAEEFVEEVGLRKLLKFIQFF